MLLVVDARGSRAMRGSLSEYPEAEKRIGTELEEKKCFEIGKCIEIGECIE